MSIAMSICREAVEAAGAHGATAIEEVEVEIGRLEQVVDEALTTAFEIAGEGTLAGGAVLKIVRLAARLRCRPCGWDFEPQAGSFQCPRCGRADTQIVAGNDIVLKSVVCRMPEGAPTE